MGSNSSTKGLTVPFLGVIDVYILQLLNLKKEKGKNVKQQTEDMLTMLLMSQRQIVINMSVIVLNIFVSY